MTSYHWVAPRSSALIPGAHLFDSCHMFAVIGSKCMAAHRSCMCPLGRGKNVLPFPVYFGGRGGSCTDRLQRILLWNLGSVSKCQWWRTHFSTEVNLKRISSSLLSGGCFIRRPALSTPFVAFCLACAAFPTWLPSLVSAGSRSAVQIMVSQPRKIHWKGFSICANFPS